MQVVIAGYGKLAATLCEDFIAEECNITVIEIDAAKALMAEQAFDLQAIVGNCIDRNVLLMAEVWKADIFIAITDNDDTNIVVTSLVKAMNQNVYTMARVRSIQYIEQLTFLEYSLPVDEIICPEKETAEEIFAQLSFPMARKVLSFANGRAKFLEFTISERSPIGGVPLKDLRKRWKNVIICAKMDTKGEVCILHGDDMLKVGDIIQVTGLEQDLLRLYQALARSLAENEQIEAGQELTTPGRGLAAGLISSERSLTMGRIPTGQERSTDGFNAQEEYFPKQKVLIIGGGAITYSFCNHLEHLRKDMVHMDTDENFIAALKQSKRHKPLFSPQWARFIQDLQDHFIISRHQLPVGLTHEGASGLDSKGAALTSPAADPQAEKAPAIQNRWDQNLKLEKDAKELLAKEEKMARKPDPFPRFLKSATGLNIDAPINKVHIIEANPDLAKTLGVKFGFAGIQVDDGTNFEVLDELPLTDYDAVISLTGVDEENIIIGLYASKLQVPKIITKVNRRRIVALLRDQGLSNIVTPKEISADLILSKIRALMNSRGSKVKALYHTMEDQIELVTFEAGASSQTVGHTLKELQIKNDCIISYILRNNKVIFPTGDAMIQIGDEIVVATTIPHLSDLDQILLSSKTGQA